MSYAEFLWLYCLKNNIKLSDSQPEALTEEMVEGNHPSPKPCYPTEILLYCKEKLTCCKASFVLRCHSPNKNIHPHKYMHDLLFLLPSELKSCNSGTYTR